MRTHKARTCAVSCSAFLMLIAVVITAPRAYGQNVRTQEDAARLISLEKVATSEGRVSGEVHNRSSRVLRDVQLFIRYTWLWDKETKPGTADPGMSSYYTVSGDIRPGGVVPFSFQPSPAPAKASGGHFEISVSVAGYTEVFTPTK